jgi:hypothetical protein
MSGQLLHTVLVVAIVGACCCVGHRPPRPDPLDALWRAVERARREQGE